MRGRHCQKYVEKDKQERVLILQLTDEKVYVLVFGLWFAGLAVGIGTLGMTLGHAPLASRLSYIAGIVLSAYFLFMLRRWDQEER